MMQRVCGFLFVVLFVMATVSVLFGWISCHADATFLILGIFGLYTGPLWFSIAQQLDRTNDPAIVELIRFLLWLSLVATPILATVVVLIGVPWLWATIIGTGIILSAEIVSTLRLRYW